MKFMQTFLPVLSVAPASPSRLSSSSTSMQVMVYTEAAESQPSSRPSSSHTESSNVAQSSVQMAALRASCPRRLLGLFPVGALPMP